MVRVECSVRWLKSRLRSKCVEHILANKVYWGTDVFLLIFYHEHWFLGGFSSH